MATYEVNFTALQTAIGHLETTVTDMKTEIDKLENIKKDLLNDTLWKGPNKSKYFQSFEAYQSALGVLYTNAVDHLTKLTEMQKAYAGAEIN